MLIRRAEPRDVQLIGQWRQEAARWLATKGTDQWSNAGITQCEFENRVHESVAEGGTWIAETDNQVPVGTVAVDEHEDDPGLWPIELLRESFVVHRMIVPRPAAGQGIGTLLLEHAESLARAAGKRWLLLDAWTTNHELHEYYRSQGFTHFKNVAEHSTPSAALFMRRIDLGPTLWPCG